jgi:hypothetical protein
MTSRDIWRQFKETPRSKPRPAKTQAEGAPEALTKKCPKERDEFLERKRVEQGFNSFFF